MKMKLLATAGACSLILGMTGAAMAGVAPGPGTANCIGEAASTNAPVNEFVTSQTPGEVDDAIQAVLDGACETPSGKTQGRNNDQRQND